MKKKNISWQQKSPAAKVGVAVVLPPSTSTSLEGLMAS